MKLLLKFKNNSELKKPMRRKRNNLRLKKDTIEQMKIKMILAKNSIILQKKWMKQHQKFKNNTVKNKKEKKQKSNKSKINLKSRKDITGIMRKTKRLEKNLIILLKKWMKPHQRYKSNLELRSKSKRIRKLLKLKNKPNLKRKKRKVITEIMRKTKRLVKNLTILQKRWTKPLPRSKNNSELKKPMRRKRNNLKLKKDKIKKINENKIREKTQFSD